MKKRIAIITSTRAEYGLLLPLIRKMQECPVLEPAILVSGTHLLERFGNTIQYIENDGIDIAYKIPIFDDDFKSDEISVAKAIARATELTAEIFEKEKYDAMVVLGDRYELLGFCNAAAICRVPVIHLHGGEITEGAIDDKIRHAVTKLASLHFPSIKEYADRIIQMGEDPSKVHPVGALGIDNILSLKLLDKQELLKEVNVETDRPVAAVTFHPVTTESAEMAAKETDIVMECLVQSGVFSIITMPNSDVGGDVVFDRIMAAVESHPDQMCVRKSLGQLRYLSLLKNADIMIGNSSSGILESASFRLPTVDIGDRQKGRMAPANVIHCECERDAIMQAIEKGMSHEFRESLAGYVSPYGDGHAAERMIEVIKDTDFSDPQLIAKKFFDINK